MSGTAAGRRKGFSLGQAIAAAILLAAFFAVSFWLHYLQMFEPGTHVSDLWDHLRLATQGESWRFYSINTFIFLWLDKLMPGGFLVVVFMAAVETLVIPTTWWVMKRAWPAAKPFLLFLAALFSNLAIAVYIPGTGRLYLGTFSGTIWHNPTYSLLKLFAVLAFGFFLEAYAAYREKCFPVKAWLWLMAMLFLATLAKPNFIISFVPAVAILLLADFLQSKGKAFGRICWLASAALPGLGLMMAQSLLVFNPESDTGVQFSFLGVLSLHSRNIKVDLVKSLAFVLVAALFLLPQVWKAASFRVAGLNLVFGLGYCLLLAESGYRFQDANFFWGGHMAVYLMTVTMLGFLCEAMAKSLPSPKRWPEFAAYILQWGVFALHVVSGLLYLYLLLTGHPFDV